MAGDWIKMRVGLRRHPKVVRMASALQADKLRIVGALHAVWSLFDEHSMDGRLDGYTLQSIDDELGFAGFGAAMVVVGWLEAGKEFLLVPRFEEHNGQSAKRRAQDTDRKRNAREASASEADTLTTREEKEKSSSTSLRSVDRARALLPDLPEQLFKDFVELRKSKRLPITSTAVDGIRKEAGSIGWSLEQAISECCVRGWGSFKAAWTKATPPAGTPAAGSKYAAAARGIFGRQRGAAEVIDV